MFSAMRRAFQYYSFVRQRLPEPDAQNMAFESLGLVEYTPIGPGVVYHHGLRETQPRQLVSWQAVPVQGVGGLIPGQVIFQPLVDPSQTSLIGEPIANG